MLVTVVIIKAVYLTRSTKEAIRRNLLKSGYQILKDLVLFARLKVLIVKMRVLRLISNFVTLQTGKQIITIHILPVSQAVKTVRQ